ncbi:hypothetical protein E2562_002349 [Oryza meyeriana var. granulata]|uniref:Factor of DNA methylation 1-5/IDN2 domain-containing protein n=1 Tax=Oryza meyeriana var. granulata TaxID=110450 RepID=A0A6G1BIH2_9ORYZ|nr:hypothetical protein E2562_002349 [Oryza meyeriana var. granulata]
MRRHPIPSSAFPPWHLGGGEQRPAARNETGGGSGGRRSRLPEIAALPTQPAAAHHHHANHPTSPMTGKAITDMLAPPCSVGLQARVPHEPTRSTPLYVHSKLNFHKNAYSDYIDIHNCLHRVIEERGKLQQEQEAVLLLVAAKEDLTKKNEELAAEIESLKKKLQASGSRNTHEVHGSGFQNNQPEGVQTRAMHKRKRECEGHASDEVDGQELIEDLFYTSNLEQHPSVDFEDLSKEMEKIHSKLIKGFLDIDNGRRNIGIKYMGQLSDKPFQLACLEKLALKEVEAVAKASELCCFWQEQLMNPGWHPFKTVTVGDIPEDIVDTDDAKLQELHATLGEGVYRALVNGLMEMKGYCRLSDRTIVLDLWNFKEKRKATPSNMAETRGAGGHLAALASKVNSKIYFLKDVLVEYMDMKNVVDEVAEERERFQNEQHGNDAILEAMKEELEAANNELVAAKEEISQKNKELEFVKKKLQVSEAKNNQAEQHSVIASELIQQRGVQTRSMQKRRRPFQGPSGYGADDQEYTSQMNVQSPCRLELMRTPDQVKKTSAEKQKPLSQGLPGDASELELMGVNLSEELVNNNPNVGQTLGVPVSKDDDLEAVREELIKGFLEIDMGGRKLGIKEMGQLNEKVFQIACLAKLPPDEAGQASYDLYSSWQKQLSDLSWNPFKTVTVDGNCKEIVNVDDDKLQELEREWGEGAHKAVMNALMEMKEYNVLADRSIAYELWNYKDGKKATLRECVEYVCNQVKQLTVVKRRKTRRW